MKYTIVWRPSAVDQLLALWLETSDRQGLTAAADEIDPTLQNDPILRGETLAGSIRILLIEPLQVAYRVLEEDRTVVILSIQRISSSEEED